MNFDSLDTATSREQRALERKLALLFARSSDLKQQPRLNREQHVEYLYKGLTSLPSTFVSLEAARPWILYWITHSLALLKAPLPSTVDCSDITEFLSNCQHRGGGFGGSPGQLPHLAPTYAAVAAAVTTGGEAFTTVNRQTMQRFLQQRCVPPQSGGGFEVCEGGEVDVRGCYTAMATAHMLGLDKQALAESADMLEYVRRCQTYEGGIGGEPGNEAHGGYTFCGLAALMLVDQAQVLDLPRLLHWAVRCQGTVEGGFMGRTNKLVDGCYSFWQGGIFPLLQRLGPAVLSQSPVPRAPRTSSPTMSSSKGSPGRERHHDDTPLHFVVPSFPLKQPQDLRHQASLALSKAQVVADEKRRRAEALRSGDLVVDDADQLSLAERNAVDAVFAAEQAVKLAAETEDILDDCAATRSPISGGESVSNHSLEHCTEAGALMSPLYNAQALQTWLLLCCQAPGGGLRDKPGKPPDYYHTCYCLSGLSSAQHFGGLHDSEVAEEDLLAAADPLCNVLSDRLAKALLLLEGQQ